MSGRRRAAATRASAGWSSAARSVPGLRIDLDRPRQASALPVTAADLDAATHDVEVRPRAETFVTIDAAHRGVGTASCGPDTLERVPRLDRRAPLDLDPGARSRRVTIDWDPQAREWHLHNGSTSWVLAVLDNGWIGHLHAGAPLAPGRAYGHVGLPFAGYDNRVAEPVGLALPGPGVGDFRVPALVIETPDGATVLIPGTPATGSSRQAGAGWRAAGDVRRDR